MIRSENHRPQILPLEDTLTDSHKPLTDLLIQIVYHLHIYVRVTSRNACLYLNDTPEDV